MIENLNKMNQVTKKSKGELEKIIEKLPFVWQEAEEKLRDQLGKDADKFKNKYRKLYNLMVRINYDAFLVAIHRKLLSNYKEDKENLKRFVRGVKQ